MSSYTDDFTYYFFADGVLTSAASAGSVPAEIDDFCTIADAVRYVQKLGCVGACQHTLRGEFHRLCLAVLRLAVDQYGQEFPTLLRGVRGDRPDSDHKILFGTSDPKVAAFYGEIREYTKVKGLRTRSTAVSVVTDDFTGVDEEIIFFPKEG